ncbi:primosomal protein N' family DNA-binding protein [Herbiconiux sp. SYSU D00978]|uniref:primosomal protein N' family DNA-binding protein n=1 Tax=Herbiconiux sp. SYSU D00978 TaxID=2812562 RepID=UPI0027DD6368|nr:primosomal protein N' [Herbiconiux sp. SYSU D00978]
MIARVLVDSPLPQLDRLFDYAVPEALRADIAVGIRVRVPLRSAGRIADAFVVELAETGSFGGNLSDVDAIVSTAPVLTPEVYTLARAVADRAAGSAIDVVRLAVPKRQVRVEKAWLAALAAGGIPARAEVTAASVTGYPSGLVETAIHERRRLALDAIPHPVLLPPRPGHDASWVGAWALTLAQAATQAIDSGGSAILAVPDYRDQEQLLAALATLLPPDRVVRLDARQSGPDRYRAFLACLGDDPLVIVGTRSAVYAPAKKLALIAVWDDGDPLHSEPLAPYVHARDAALVRQGQQGCALLLAGHARSTEVERLVELGYAASVGPAPAVTPHVVPTAHQTGGDRLAQLARIPSAAWRAAREALSDGPVLVQVARPGYTPALACRDCGSAARCRRCEGPLTVTHSGAVPSCAWCGALATGWECSVCGGTHLRPAGVGASRTADELGRAFPGVRVIVSDGERPLLAVDDRPALVIATRGAEPLAQGGYRAVLLLDGERMLARESLRVAEDCLRWWANAAALASPRAPVVLVGVGGALASALATWRLPEFARQELADRRRLRFPPAVRVASVTGTLDSVQRALDALDDPDVLGPVDVPSGGVRAIVRFDYARGHAVAEALRGAVITGAVSRRKSLKGGDRRPAPTLRVRFDDSEPFDDQ